MKMDIITSILWEPSIPSSGSAAIWSKRTSSIQHTFFWQCSNMEQKDQFYPAYLLLAVQQYGAKGPVLSSIPSAGSAAIWSKRTSSIQHTFFWQCSNMEQRDQFYPAYLLLAVQQYGTKGPVLSSIPSSGSAAIWSKITSSIQQTSFWQCSNMEQKDQFYPAYLLLAVQQYGAKGPVLSSIPSSGSAAIWSKRTSSSQHTLFWQCSNMEQKDQFYPAYLLLAVQQYGTKGPVLSSIPSSGSATIWNKGTSSIQHTFFWQCSNMEQRDQFYPAYLLLAVQQYGTKGPVLSSIPSSGSAAIWSKITSSIQQTSFWQCSNMEQKDQFYPAYLLLAVQQYGAKGPVLSSIPSSGSAAIWSKRTSSSQHTLFWQCSNMEQKDQFYPAYLLLAVQQYGTKGPVLSSIPSSGSATIWNKRDQFYPAYLLLAVQQYGAKGPVLSSIPSSGSAAIWSKRISSIQHTFFWQCSNMEQNDQFYPAYLLLAVQQYGAKGPVLCY